MSRPTNTNHASPPLTGNGVPRQRMDTLPVTLARVSRTDNTPECPVGHDDKVFALLIMAALGAGGAAGDGPATPLVDVLQKCQVQTHARISGLMNATPR